MDYVSCDAMLCILRTRDENTRLKFMPSPRRTSGSDICDMASRTLDEECNVGEQHSDPCFDFGEAKLASELCYLLGMQTFFMLE